LRFRYALMTCLAVQLCCIHGFATLAPFSPDRMLQFDTFFAGVTLFSLFGCYHFEREHRLGYLLRRRDRLRNGELEIMSCRDALTGIGNRRALEAALKRGATGDDAGTPRNTAVILVDIDHFKLFNDTNGHQDGDACLKRVASLIVASLEGQQGVAYRFGGEEFLVLLDDATLDEAVSVAETIRRHVADARIPRAVHANTVVTVSAGVAVGTIGHGVTAETVIADADGSLYAAKREGRDLVRSTRRDTQEQAPAAALMETPRLVA
jgi:diguanylate cyclase (GGDEF)-like protein